MSFAAASETGPVLVRGRRLAIAALCGPAADLLLLISSVFWAYQATSATQRAASLSTAVTAGTLVFVSLSSHNDFRIAPKAWTARA